jgi:mRNA-degrading endonuclease toxin of MazEF toxin-antitoxin module
MSGQVTHTLRIQDLIAHEVPFLRKGCRLKSQRPSVALVQPCRTISTVRRGCRLGPLSDSRTITD